MRAGTGRGIVSMGISIVVLLWGTSRAFAQAAASDAVPAGYRLLWAGDKAGALRHFDSLAKSRPTDAAARFGLLMAQDTSLSADASLRGAYEQGLDNFIALVDGRYGRSKQDAEALFYLAQAHLLRAEYRFDHNKGLFGAARDGAKAKGYADTYVKQHPEHGDAYLVLGAYNYYVDLAPMFFKALRFLLFLPPGSRVEGLKQLERAGSQGSFFGPKAQLILVEVYSAFEGRAADALAVAERLQRQYPANDDIDFALAGLFSSDAMEDYGRAAASYQEVIDRRRLDSTLDGSRARYRALQGLSAARLSQWRVDEAVAALAPPIEAGVTNPDWVLPEFLLRRGSYRAVLNDPAASDDAHRVLGEARLTQWHQAAIDQIKSIEQRRASGEAAISAALVPGNRLVAEGKFDEARKVYDAVASAHPQHANVRYRLAYLDFARGEAERALPAFATLAADKTAPLQVRANSLLYVGRAHDLAGRRTAARKTYEKVIDDFDKQRAANQARAGLLTPYKRPARRTS